MPLEDFNVDFKFSEDCLREFFEISLEWEYATTSSDIALNPKPKSEL